MNKQPGAGVAKWSFGDPTSSQAAQKPLYDAINTAEVMPPWLQEIRDNFLSLILKQIVSIKTSLLLELKYKLKGLESAI